MTPAQVADLIARVRRNSRVHHACAACGGTDHRASADGPDCSPSYRGALMVLRDGLSNREAARRVGIREASVRRCVRGFR